jgi:hypothetical protein
MTKRMSRRGGRGSGSGSGSVEAGGVMAVEKQMQPESERACRRGKGKGRGDTTGRSHEVGQWVGLVEPLGNYDEMMRSPAWGQEQAADWLQIGIRGWAN